MVGKTAAERKAAERARRTENGLQRFEVWCHPKDWPTIKLLVKKLAKWRERK